MDSSLSSYILKLFISNLKLLELNTLLKFIFLCRNRRDRLYLLYLVSFLHVLLSC